MRIPAPMTGVAPRDIATDVDAVAVARAFVDARRDPEGATGTLSTDEFHECLLRLADVRYAGVAEMDRSGRLRGLASTVLDGVSVADVLRG